LSVDFVLVLTGFRKQCGSCHLVRDNSEASRERSNSVRGSHVRYLVSIVLPIADCPIASLPSPFQKYKRVGV
jgi:hypothetical protein